MPQSPAIVATKPEAAEVYIFDCSRHPHGLEDAAVEEAEGRDGSGAACPEHILRGHSGSGFAVSWSPHLPGQLLSGATDGLVCLWDIGSGAQVFLGPEGPLAVEAHV